MMRSLFLLAVTFFMTDLLTAQSWEDSLRIGKKYYQENQFDKAYKTLLEAQKLAPSNVDLSQDIGNAAYRNKDFEMAEKAFRAAASGDIDESKNAKNWHNIGNSQMKAKNYTDAIESYKQSLRKNSKNEKTRYNLSEAQRRLKVQEERQKKNDQDQEGQDDEQSKNDQQDKNNKENPGEENKEQQKDPSQQSGNSDEKSNAKPASKLSNRKTERLLEELLKQEMQTKKKVRGQESIKNKQQIKSGKRW